MQCQEPNIELDEIQQAVVEKLINCYWIKCWIYCSISVEHCNRKLVFDIYIYIGINFYVECDSRNLSCFKKSLKPEDSNYTICLTYLVPLDYH